MSLAKTMAVGQIGHRCLVLRALRRRACACVLAALLPASATALDPQRSLTQYAARTWGPENGLTQKDVLSIVQTPDGYLWLGTMEGLLRFDGVRFTVFDKNNTPGLRHSYVWTLLVDREGALWVGTYGGGLSRYKDGEFTSYTQEDGLAGAIVRSLSESAGGGLWIGTNTGLSRFRDGRFTTSTTRDGLSSDYVRAVHEDRSGAVWVGTTAGLDRLENGRFSPVPTLDGRGRASVRPVHALHGGRDGSLWIGTAGGGVNRLRQGVLTAFTTKQGLASDLVNALVEDRDGNLWVGTSGGVSRLRDGRIQTYTVADGLPNASVYALFEDAEGSLWIGTTGVRGLHRFMNAKVVVYGRPEGLPTERIWSIHEGRDGSVWIAGSGGALARFHDGRFTTLRHWPPHRTLRAVLETRDGSLWIGSEGGGLSRLKDGRLVTYTTRDGLPSDTIWALAEGPDGALWIGTEGGGLASMRDGGFKVLTKKDGLPSDVVRAVYCGRDGSLWLGTNGGLVGLTEGRLTVRGERDGLSSDLVRSIYEDEDGVLWVGTLGGGLNRVKDGRITRYVVKDGLFDDVVWSLLEDGEGRLWMSGNKGLFSVAKKALNAYAAGQALSIQGTSYDVLDGLRGGGSSGGSYPAAARTRDGRLWFPTVKGVVVVVPAAISGNDRLPPVHVEEVLVNGKLLARDGGRIAQGRGGLEFRYTALSLVAPERVAFKYRLDGFDVGWVEAGTRRTAYYTNVPPGRYRFHVIARNNDGLWNETGAAMAIELLPRFHQTGWFYALLLLSAAAAVVGLHAFRLRSLQSRERELARRVEDSLAHIKVLRGLLPICSACKKIRDDAGYWSRIENYIAAHSEAAFSHGICPDCLRWLYPQYAEMVTAPARETPPP